jgi:hypothetical protein
LILRQPGGISSRLSCLPNPSQPGQPVVVKVYVRPTEPTHSAPRGTVAFTVDGRLVGGATLDASGVAQTQIALPTLGDHDIVIEYLGDSDSEPSSRPGNVTMGRNQRCDQFAWRLCP